MKHPEEVVLKHSDEKIPFDSLTDREKEIFEAGRISDNEYIVAEIFFFMIIVVIAALFLGYYTPHPLFK